MSGLFGKKPTAKEQMRKNDRELRKAGREVERERNKLTAEEKKLEAEIRKAAKTGDKTVLAVLAKQLVQLRKQKTRSFAASSQIQSVASQSKAMGANVAIADSMKATGKVMTSMNKQLDPAKIGAEMNKFSRESQKLEMTDELVSDTLDDMLNESGDEEESDAIVSQVLDEIGIEISGKVSEAPKAGSSKLENTDTISDQDIERQLAQLRS